MDLLNVVLISISVMIICFLLIILVPSLYKNCVLSINLTSSLFKDKRYCFYIIAVFILIFLLGINRIYYYSDNGNDYDDRKEKYFSNKQYVYFQKLVSKHRYEKAEIISTKV